MSNSIVPQDQHGAPARAGELAAEPKLPERRLPTTKVDKIAGAIAAVMAEVGVVSKRGVNQFHRYKYVQMQDVLQEITPLLAKHGLMIVQTEVGRAMFDEDRAVSVQYEFAIAHSSGQVWPERIKQTGLSRCRDSKGGFDDKALNKCHTAARKYFLMSLFQVPTGDEDDADRGANDGPPRRSPPRPAENVMSPYPSPSSPQLPAHDPETGEVFEPGDPPSSATAADQSAPAADAGADAVTSDEVNAGDRKLAEAAEQGMAALEAAWKGLRTPVKKVLKAALDRHKRRAETVDGAAKKTR
jgi:hypothetical protein